MSATTLTTDHCSPSIALTPHRAEPDFRLARVSHEVAEAYGCDPATLPNHRRNYADALSGRLPAWQNPRSMHWMVRRADLPRIAAMWGILPTPAPSPQAGDAHRALATVAA